MSITKDVAVRLHLNGADTVKAQLTGVTEQADRLGTKTATLSIDAHDDDFMVQAGEVLAKAKELGATKVRIAVSADDAHAKVALDEIRAKADELGLKKVNIKVDVDKSSEAKISALSRMLSLGGAGSTLAGMGDVFSIFSKDASMAQKAMSGVGAATGLLEAPVSGLIVGIGGLASGLAAAGMGMMAFGAVAKANLTTASTAASAVQTAQINYNAAIKAGTSHATAYAAEQKAIAVAYAQLSPAQIALSKQIGNVQNQWQSFVQANTTGVSTILSQGMGLLPKLFQSMQAFMKPVEGALSGLITQLGHGLDSNGFKSFIDMMAANSGPAITKIGDAIGHIVVGLGGIIKAFMPFAQTMLGGLDKITGKFATWGQTLTQHSGFQSLVSMAKSDMPYVIEIVKNLGATFVRLAGSMAGLSTLSNSHSLLALAAPLSQLLADLAKSNPQLLTFGLYMLAGAQALGKLKTAFSGVGTLFGTVKDGVTGVKNLVSGFGDAEAAASDATGVWGTFGGKLSTAVTAVKNWGIWSKVASAATKVWTGVQAAFDAVMDANPIALVILAVAALAAGIVILIIKVRPFREFWIRLWHDVTAVISTVFDWIKTHWPLVLGILTGPIGLAVLFIVRHWDQITAGARNMFNSVVGFFRSLPGRILSALGNLGRLLWNAGTSIISGLLGGIEQKFNDVKHFVGGVASWISAHKGPISYDATLLVPHGQAIMGGLVQGLNNGMPGLNNQLAKTTGVIANTKVPALSGAGGSGAVNINFNGIVTDPNGTARKLQQMLLDLKRHNGGRDLGLT